MRLLSDYSGRSARPEERGVALLYAVFGAFVALSMTGIMFTMSGVTSKRSETKRSSVEADYLAEGAVEAAKKVVQEAVANWEVPPASGTVEINGVQVPYTIDATGGSNLVTDSAGIQTIHTGYEIFASAEVDGMKSVAHRIINAESTPIFQFAVFYTNDLEVQPGPSMTLGGRVHTNGDMYLGCGSASTLELDTNYVRSLGKIYRKRKNNPSSNGNVEVRKWVENPFDALEPEEFEVMNSKSQMDEVATSSGYDSDFTSGYDINGDGDFTDEDEWLPFVAGALELWSEPDGYGEQGNTVLTGEHGVSEAVTPSIGSIQMFEESESGSYVYSAVQEQYVYRGPGFGTHDKGYYHQNAGLAIIVSDDGTSFTAYDADGVEVPAIDLDGAVTMDEIYDARQGGDVPILEVDISLLKDASAWPANGLLYVAHYGMADGTDSKGVQLIEGTELASSLTVVTEGAAYVKGDYNTVNKKGSAIIADAVNLLSNAWDGSKSKDTLPTATDTTYNCAIVTGNYETESGVYNGGLENLPRFHEQWTSKNCNIYGSFVNAWESQYATGLWSYGGDYYKAPRRNWFYDTMFNSVASLPPFTPMAVTASDIISW